VSSRTAHAGHTLCVSSCAEWLTLQSLQQRRSVLRNTDDTESSRNYAVVKYGIVRPTACWRAPPTISGKLKHAHRHTSHWCTSVFTSSSLRTSCRLSMISPVSAVSIRRHLRSAGQGDLVVPRTRTTGFGPRSFSVAGPLAWNSLPPEIKTTSLTLGQFSGRLKTEMFIRSYYASAQPS